MNANYTQAYVSMGKAYMSMGEYKTAMEYFELGQSKTDYGEAKAQLREEIVRENFATIAIIIIILLVGILGSDFLKSLYWKISWRLRKK